MPRPRRAARVAATAWDYLGVLLVLVAGVACGAIGVARTEWSLLVIGGAIVAIALIWLIAFKGVGGGADLP